MTKAWWHAQKHVKKYVEVVTDDYDRTFTGAKIDMSYHYFSGDEYPLTFTERRAREQRYGDRETGQRFGGVRRDVDIYRMRDHFQRGLQAAGWKVLKNRMEFEAYDREFRKPAYFVVKSDGMGSFEVIVLERRDISSIERVFKNPCIMECGVWINQMPSDTNDIFAICTPSTNAWYEHWTLLKQLWDTWERDNRS